MDYRVGLIFVFKQGDKYLVSHPSKALDHEWYFPGGGIDTGESWEETFLREAYEELGLRPSDLVSYVNTGIAYSYDWPQKLVDEKGFLGQKKTFIFAKLKKSVAVDITITNELDGINWCTWAELFRVIPFDNIKNVLKNNPSCFEGKN